MEKGGKRTLNGMRRSLMRNQAVKEVAGDLTDDPSSSGRRTLIDSKAEHSHLQMHCFQIVLMN